MGLTLLVGGARSGKSRTALMLASTAKGNAGVTFVATAQGLDDDLKSRIAIHRAERPKPWQTIEESVELEKALLEVDPSHLVVIDCLTLWVSNLFDSGITDDEIICKARAVALTASLHRGSVVVVSNEVGCGIVPITEVARRYRDVLGTVNSVFSARAASAFLVVAGRLLPLVAPGDITVEL